MDKEISIVARRKPPSNVDVKGIDSTVLSKSVGLSAEGRFDESEAELEPWLKIGFPGAIFNKGWHLMRRTGDLQAGRLFDVGRQLGCFGDPPIRGPEWFGDKPIEGRRVLVYLEGGLGDELVGCRFLVPLQERGVRVIAACSPPLHELFRCLPVPIVTREAAQAGLVPFDLWIPGMSLSWRMMYNRDTLPGKQAYLKPTAEAVERWRHAMGPSTGKVRIGLRWRGNDQPAMERDFPIKDYFEMLAPFKDKVEFVSLQLGLESIDRPKWVKDYSPWLSDMNETAALMQQLDLIITSCTSVAHLASAIGTEAWVVVPLMCYYTWLIPWGGERSIYYDSVRLFRQEHYDDWTVPLTRIGERLREKVEAN